MEKAQSVYCMSFLPKPIVVFKHISYIKSPANNCKLKVVVNINQYHTQEKDYCINTQKWRQYRTAY